MTREFWTATLYRAIRTICQTAIATIGTAMVITEVNWTYVVSASALAGLLSVLTSVATGLPEVELQETLYSLDNVIFEEDEEDDYVYDPADEVSIPQGGDE